MFQSPWLELKNRDHNFLEILIFIDMSSVQELGLT
ncbi:hypothetical protein PMIT1306_01225 [Prochlorococcus sp. MIT 1306]|nr:hypothetical protein PMIT1306_01225 [Prochlorococcus sp. MIT 1306]